ncbi:MAG: hypothetical protein ACFFCW_42220 [Candidatus Hodarchaeota archaeon]
MAVVSIIILFATDAALNKLAAPDISISTIQRDKNIDIQFQIHEPFWGIATGKIRNIYLVFPVSGIIEDFKDHNAITQAQTEAFLIGGSEPGTQLCHLELFINHIAPSATLSYSIIFSPSQKTAEPELRKLGQKWPDRYELRYTWNFRGAEYSVNQWRLVSSNSVVEAPEYRLWAVTTSESPKTPSTINKTKLK